jgi:hypothetical protein
MNRIKSRKANFWKPFSPAMSKRPCRRNSWLLPAFLERDAGIPGPSLLIVKWKRERWRFGCILGQTPGPARILIEERRFRFKIHRRGEESPEKQHP